MSKVIKAVFTGRFCTTRRVFQWDTDDKLQFVNLDLPQNYTVDFANSLTGQSVSVLATSDTVQIPPEMMTPDSEIYAWVWISDTNGGHTKCQATIPIDPRAQRSGTSPTPAQASAWDQAVQALSDAAADYETAISHAPIIQNGYWYIWDSTASEYVTTDVKAEGVDGAGVWYTTDRISGNENPFVRRRSLIGREGATVQVHDLLFAPDAGYDGAPTTLYEIASVGITCALNRLCKMQGDDGYSPVVTITEITGGHRVTITDEEHPSGQSFDVMDGTGGGGTSDYSDLTNKPQINSVTLSGNKSLSDLGAEPKAFLVTITNSGGSYSADKTYSEIVAAAAAGKRVVATIDDVYFSYYGLVNGGDALFYNIKQLTGSFWSISSSNVLTHYTSTAGNYSKPVSGIPATDLASAVQTSLGKADTALQSAPVTSVNGQTGTVTLSIPSTAADVGAVAANQGAANANKVLKVNSSGVVAPEDNRFVVTLTPTSQDFSGVMDKTVAEINVAYEAGKKIVFKVLGGANEVTYADCSMQYANGSYTYPSFNGFIISDAATPNLLIFAFTSVTNDGTKATYAAHVYPFATGQWTGGSY